MIEDSAASGGEFGPRMRALTELQRRFVLAMFAAPLGNATQWARAAGYSAASSVGLRGTGHRLTHDPRIAEAVQEYALTQLTSVGPVLGIGVMMKIARTKGHKHQLKAASALANRAGFHETTEHHVTVDHRGGDDVLRRIRDAAALLGIDASRLLGANANEPKVIEHQPEGA